MFSGKGMNNEIHLIIGDTQIEDLWIPYFWLGPKSSIFHRRYGYFGALALHDLFGALALHDHFGALALHDHFGALVPLFYLIFPNLAFMG